MAVAVNASKDMLQSISRRPDEALVNVRTSQEGLVVDELIDELMEVTMDVTADETAVSAAHGRTGCSPAPLDVHLLCCKEGEGGGARGDRKVQKLAVKWPSDSALVKVQFFEPVESITDEERDLLEKMKQLPPGIQEFLLTQTNLVVCGSEKLRLALCPHQSSPSDRCNSLHSSTVKKYGRSLEF
jgi:hypothetical protein